MVLNKEILQKARQLFSDKKYEKVVELLSPIPGEVHSNIIHGLAHGFVGKAFYQLADYKQAVNHLRSAVEYIPEDEKLHYYLGVTCLAINQLQEGKACFEKAIELNPKNESYYLNLGATYRRLQQISKAEESYRHMIAINPKSTRAYRNLSLCVHYQDPNHQDKQNVENILRTEKLNNEEKAQCYFTLGKIAKDCKQFEQAVDNYNNGNFYKNKSVEFNPKKYSKRLDDIITLFPKAVFENLPTSQNEHNNATPIFIIGLPRSGKTLIESILQHHPGLLPLEEFGKVDKFVYEIGRRHNTKNLFSDYQQFLSQEVAGIMVEKYFKQIEMRAAIPYQAFTDTTPCNFRYLGFIAMMFPQAKIIHVHRNPFDHLLQLYFKYFSSGNFWSYDISNIIHYYREYRRMMNHWYSVLPMPFKSISYESLIQRPDETIAALFDYTGLTLDLSLHLSNIKAELHSDEINVWSLYEQYFKHNHHQLEQLKQFLS